MAIPYIFDLGEGNVFVNDYYSKRFISIIILPLFLYVLGYTFLNKNSLAAGVLILKPGEEDTQLPHDSDEMYYILEGDGFLKIKNKNYSIKKGKAFFVPKNTEHYFFGNKKKLQVIYFFGGSDD